MKTKTHTNKLQKNSGLFLQLGLVLTLAIVYALFEHQTEINVPIAYKSNPKPQDSDIYMYDVQVERVKVKEPQRKVLIAKQKFIEEFDKSDVDDKVETTLDFNPEDKVTPVDVISKLVNIAPEDDFIEDVPFAIIEDAPIYPGCEKKKEKEAMKKCFSDKISKFVARKFNGDLASVLRLSKGKQTIFVQFTITKTGEIEINGAKAAHKRLEKEGERVVGLLPKMSPGKQRGKPVNVKYMLPIRFNVE